jgi:signal transduction histidine kinase
LRNPTGSFAVLRTGRPARMDSYENAAASPAARIRAPGPRSRVGAPIVVDEQLSGLAIAGWSRPEPLPADSAERIAAAADEARRRLERDLHDGAQQRLVSLGLKLRTAQQSVPPDLADLQDELSEVVSGLTASSHELQEISRGIHPASAGLGPALKTLARRSAVPVSLDVAIDRRPNRSKSPPTTWWPKRWPTPPRPPR